MRNRDLERSSAALQNIATPPTQTKQEPERGSRDRHRHYTDMPALPSALTFTQLSASQLVKRDWCYGTNCSSTWTWARWILFVLFILGLLLIILSAIRVNKRRGIEGRDPIRGTAWITPPSYTQAQQQRQQEPYVPPYTAEANDQDLGYYDTQGVFHANTKAQMAHADGYRLDTLVPDQTGVSAPGAAQVTGDNPTTDFNRQFQRYYGNTAGASSNSNATGAVNENNEDDDFTRPAGPPPAHVRN